MNLSLQARGASFIAMQKKNNPRDLIIRLVEDNPGAERDELFEKFQRQIDGDVDYQRAVDWYFFVNMHDYLVRKDRHMVLSPQERAQRETVSRQRVADIKRKIVEVVLLDLTLPNGKVLRNATFADCAKAGGWFARLGKMGAAKEIVGKKLTETDLRKIR